MGTRGLYAAVIDSTMPLAQYGQWDAYPSGQGLTTLAFVRSLAADGERERTFAAALRKLRAVTKEDQIDYYAKAGVVLDPSTPWITVDDAKRIAEVVPQMSRDTCADIFELVAAGGVEFVNTESDFAHDGLFCEWAYVVDLDRHELRVYAGGWQDDEGLTAADLDAATAVYQFGALPEDDEFLRLERD